jgi:hypothetical protein
MLRRVTLVGTDVSELLSASIILVRRFCHPDDDGAKFLQNEGFLQEPHGVTFQKTEFFLITLSYLIGSPTRDLPAYGTNPQLRYLKNKIIVIANCSLDGSSVFTG